VTGRSERGRLKALLTAGLRFVRTHPGACSELVVGGFLAWTFLVPADMRALVGRLVVDAVGSLRALWLFLRVDTRGTIETAGFAAIKLLVMTLPLLLMALRWRSWERLRILFWLPIVIVFWPLASTSRFPPLAIASAVSLALSRIRWLQWTVIIPFVTVAGPAASHLAGATVWGQADLEQRCAMHDGKRPINLDPEQLAAGYMGITELRPGEVLLAGQPPTREHLPFFGSRSRGPKAGGSWWLRRNGNDWEIEARSQVKEMFWQGCRIGDELWLSKAKIMDAVRRDAQTGVESLREFQIPSDAIDFSEVVCLPEQDRVLIGEGLSNSGIWEVNTKTGAIRRLAHEVGGLGALARRGKPGQLVAVNGTDLVVYSLEKEEVIERTSGALQMFGGLDVCPLNQEAAVPDLSGRLRFFTPGADGQYHFDWGVSVHAPRLVKYSPDCKYLVATSLDDESAWLIDTTARRVAATYRAGPVLRGTTFLGPREFAIADACTMSDFVF
jgi:hypothetical protein